VTAMPEPVQAASGVTPNGGLGHAQPLTPLTQSDSVSLANDALWYASHGIPVFRCWPRAKEPMTTHGFKDATTSEACIASWWRTRPDANIGIPTGKTSGLLVVDVDPRNGGDESLEDLVRKYGPLPETAEQITGGGGRHLVFRHSGSIGLPKTLAPGIDLKGDGGYIVVAPSIHPSGRKYDWDGTPVAKLF